MSGPYRRVGRVIGTHGKTGEVVVVPSDHLSCDVLDGLDVWIVPPPEGKAISRKILGVRHVPKGLLVRIEGVEDTSQSHEAVGRWLLARSSSVPDLPAGPEDEIGYRVIDVDHGDLGVVASVIITGANDVFVVEGGPYGEVLLPVIEDVILSIDRSARQVTVRVLPGLIEGVDA